MLRGLWGLACKSSCVLECADLSALWSLATCRQQRRDRSRRTESDDRSPNSKLPSLMYHCYQP